MRILVYPHDLAVGGSQLNAIELAAGAQRLGHQAVIFGRPGALVPYIEQLGLEFVASDAPHRRPDLRIAARLRQEITSRGIDVVHGYEWPPTLEALIAARGRAAVVSTVMSMAVAPFIPTGTPLVVGTEQIAHAERGGGRSAVHLLEPPVDTQQNAPDAVSTAGFRARFGIGEELVITVVTRLANELKLEGILAAIRAVEELSARRRVTLVIVGDGPARDTVRAAADAAALRVGRRVVVLTGEILDPRAAYASADILLGMGGSALRAMAFAKPLVVQGEHGFWRTLRPETLDHFLWAGWYGIGDDASRGHIALLHELAPLLDDAERRAALGRFGREVVERRFALTLAVERQLAIYRQAIDAPQARQTARAVQTAISAARFARYKVGMLAARLKGPGVADDFNARPVAASRIERPAEGSA
jgi:glycosyltransferase involved in cell wall biosynthesis